MTSHLHFELIMRELRLRSSAQGQLAQTNLRPHESEDVGHVRLSRIEEAMKETRADRTEE